MKIYEPLYTLLKIEIRVLKGIPLKKDIQRETLSWHDTLRFDS